MANSEPKKAKKNYDLFNSFFFIKPQENTDVDELADKLIKINEVQEVHVKKGTIGYMVNAKFDKNTHDAVKRKMAHAAGPRYGKFVSAMEVKRSMK